jgi:hypothetical protein
MNSLIIRLKLVYCKKLRTMFLPMVIASFSSLCAIFLFMILSSTLTAQVRFIDDFSDGLAKWDLMGEQAIMIIDSKDPDHGKVLMLRPDGIVYALIKDSDQWGGIRVEGELLFPTDEHNYLGLIYNYTHNISRTDFGSIYIKGNGSYLRVNPHRDGNPSRLLYEEYKTPLKGNQAISINEWHQFKAEIIGSMCHFYVGDMSTPKVTFGLFENTSGLIGFKPRVVGGIVWIDNIKITSIEHLGYNGPSLPNIVYEPDSLILNWDVIGPFEKPIGEIEKRKELLKSEIVINNISYSWKPFQTDSRGTVITGRITEYSGEGSTAYFRTLIHSQIKKTAILHFSTIDEIGLWVNGVFNGFIYRDGYVSGEENDWNAWYDFWKNPNHIGRKVPIELIPGKNQIIVRVRNGQYASGGFFVYLESK